VTLLSVNPWFGLILIIATTPELIVEIKTWYRMWWIYSAKAEVRRKYSFFSSLFNRKECITELKLFWNVSYFLERIKRLFLDFSEEQSKIERWRLFWSIGSNLFAQSWVIVVATWMIDMTMHWDIKIGTFAFLFSLITGFQQSLSQLFRHLGQQSEDALHTEDYFAYLELENTVVLKTWWIKLPSNPPTILFENVSFAYPETEKLVLRNINLEIQPGEKLAIVWVNGAGKSTLIKLLFRFYDPTEWRILVNGIDLKEIDGNDWYRHLGALFQEFVNYKLPLRDAVAIGDTSVDISDDRVISALNRWEATGFTSSWQNWLGQQLWKDFTGGVEPSVWQWQKLALARVFYRDANIYVLDEPTSAIDAEAEANVFANLASLPVDKTVLFVSHRFSTIRQASRICVIEDGTISELWSHEELVANRATYKRLFELQAKGYQ
jgi:ABC-type multidrug transport system fused ATPase/permease subunit